MNAHQFEWCKQKKNRQKYNNNNETGKVQIYNENKTKKQQQTFGAVLF